MFSMCLPPSSLDLKPYFTPLSVELFQLITRTFQALPSFIIYLHFAAFCWH